MPRENPLLKMTPEKFEKYVRGIMKREKMPIKDMEVTHLEPVPGMDGEYKMDVVATFCAFGGAHFRCLIECKRHSSSIEREIVMVLEQKLQSTGSHKGMIFSTSTFQSGAIEFAKAHGIALVYVQWGRKHVFVVNAEGDGEPYTPTEEERLLDSWTAELVTDLGYHPYPYLGRPDVYDGQNLKRHFGLGSRSEDWE